MKKFIEISTMKLNKGLLILEEKDFKDIRGIVPKIVEERFNAVFYPSDTSIILVEEMLDIIQPNMSQNGTINIFYNINSTIEITPLVDLLNDMYEEDFFIVNSEYNNTMMLNLYVIIEEVPVLVQSYSKNYKDISYKDTKKELKEFDKELFNNVVNSSKTDYFCTFADIKQSLTLK